MLEEKGEACLQAVLMTFMQWRHGRETPQMDGECWCVW